MVADEEVMRRLAQHAWAYLNDQCRLDLCLRFDTRHIACAATLVASRHPDVNVTLPSPQWIKALGADPGSVEIIVSELLETYDRPLPAWVDPLHQGSFLLSQAIFDAEEEGRAPAATPVPATTGTTAAAASEDPKVQEERGPQEEAAVTAASAPVTKHATDAKEASQPSSAAASAAAAADGTVPDAAERRSVETQKPHDPRKQDVPPQNPEEPLEENRGEWRQEARYQSIFFMHEEMPPPALRSLCAELDQNTSSQKTDDLLGATAR